MGRQAERRSLKVPVIIRPGFTLYFERSLGFTFIHCYIHKPWTPALKRSLQDTFRKLRDLHGDTIYALHEPGDRKHEKFLTMFGFTFNAPFVDADDGTTRHLYSIN